MFRMKVKVAQSCLTLFDLMNYTVHGILQARIVPHLDLLVFNSLYLQFSQIFAAAAAAKSLQLCPTLCDPIDGSPPGSCPWDSPGKNTGVGCHFLLQCMKVKSESQVTQSCPTSRSHGLQPTRLLHPWHFPGKSTGVGCHCLLLQIFAEKRLLG